jgi:hypothetical protein
MKNRFKICTILAISLTVCLSVQGQPLTGTWTFDKDGIPAGSWTELLWGSGEGKAGNEIRAVNPGFYTFDSATIGGDPGDVVLLQDCTDPDYLAFVYRTFYYGGILELFDGAGPWSSGTDLSFVASMGPVKNITTKNVGLACDQTGEDIAFDLTMVGVFGKYTDYAAHVTADYGGPANLDTSGFPPFLFGDLTSATITIARIVPVYVKPGSCKNPVNVKSQGVIPVVVMGTESLDLSTINPSQVTLEGVLPSHWAWEDVGGPAEPVEGPDGLDCSDAEIPDGIIDLVLKFSTQAVISQIAPVEDGDMVSLTLLGETEEFPVLGQDVITILNRGRVRVRNEDGERQDNGNHYGWTNGNGHAYGRNKDVSPVLGRSRNHNENGLEDPADGNRGNGNANGRDNDKGNNKDKEKDNNGKNNGSDKGNGKKNGHNKNGG